MRPVAEFLRNQQPADTRRLLLALLVSLLSLVVGFHAVGLSAAETFLREGGYWFMLGLVSLFVASLWLFWRAEPPALGRLWSVHRAGIVTVLLCSVLVLSMDRMGYKVQFDEQVIQATAQNLHFTKEVGALVRAYEVGGSFLPLDAMMDKRPLLLPFVGSLLHDLTGYRTLNLFLFNAALVPVLLGLVYHLGARLGGKGVGVVAVLALSTLPLLGQTATSSGMEMLNLTMLAATIAAALAYVAAPEPRRLTLLCLCSVLLSQCRYESVIFALPVCICIVWGWWKAGRILLPWQACATPLFFIPYALHNRVLSASPRLWQLGEGQSSRFSLDYLPGNLEGALRYLFVHDMNLTASLLLGYLGLLSLLALPWLLRRGWRPGGALSGLAVLGLFGLLVLGNLAMLMFYYWAKLDDPVASRFALPLYLFLALTIGLVLVRLLQDRVWGWRIAGAAFFVYVMAFLRPATAHAFYTEYNLSAQVVEWETSLIAGMPPCSRLVIANRSSLPFIIECRPCLPRFGIEHSLEKIRFHLEARTFEEVLVLQTLRPGSTEGDYYVDEKDALPEGWETEVVAEKRFGAVLERVSRLRTLPVAKAALAEHAVPVLPAAGGSSGR